MAEGDTPKYNKRQSNYGPPEAFTEDVTPGDGSEVIGGKGERGAEYCGYPITPSKGGSSNPFPGKPF